MPDEAHHPHARALVESDHRRDPRPRAACFPHDAEYLAASVARLRRAGPTDGFGVPDFLDSLVAFQPQQHRVDGIRHLVVFPMYTQNGSRDRLRRGAASSRSSGPSSSRELEAGDYGNKLFVSLRLVDFTPGYDTNSAVLFPETVAMREIPTFTWGAIFQDREAARYRRVVRAASEITKLDLPADAARMLDDQAAHRGDLRDVGPHPRPHAHARRPAVRPVHDQAADAVLPVLARGAALRPHGVPRVRRDRARLRARRRRRRARATSRPRCSSTRVLVQYAVIFDRIFRFAITGTRVRNYDGLGGQLLFAWLHQHGVLHWTDTSLAFDWDECRTPWSRSATRSTSCTGARSTARRPRTGSPPTSWCAARSRRTRRRQWARGLPDEVLAGPPKGYTDAVLDDEFPLSMFYEALEKKMRPVIESTVGHPRRRMTDARDRRRVRSARRATERPASRRLASPAVASASQVGCVIIAGATSDGVAASPRPSRAGARVVAVGRDRAKLARSRQTCRASTRGLRPDRRIRRRARSRERVHADGRAGRRHPAPRRRLARRRRPRRADRGGLPVPRALVHRAAARQPRVRRRPAGVAPAGRLAIVSSTAVARPLAGGANYAAVKAASEAWTRAVAQGFAKEARDAGRPLRAASVIFRVKSLEGLADAASLAQRVSPALVWTDDCRHRSTHQRRRH